jgi:hypothetical protein
MQEMDDMQEMDIGHIQYDMQEMQEMDKGHIQCDMQEMDKGHIQCDMQQDGYRAHTIRHARDG